MSTREQFGKYLLLKKLAEDSLGETFRAGMLGNKGMERVALLRVMNGQGIDGQRLWAASRDRAPVQKSLRSPNIGDGIEMGEVQGIPFVAYDYVSGKNLATLFDQAAKQRSPISTDHALLIAERLSLALSVAAEHRYQGDRILHGFLVPHLVMISNEGETRLLGFEFAPGLRAFIGNPVLRRHFGRYLAPEALAGAQADKSDDVYSLGVLLYELLIGQPLPAPTGDGYADLIDRSSLAADDKPIPDGPAQLLKQSLVPRDRRMRDVAQWHKTLAGWMAEGQLNPTTFNLAFYMHNLYRQDIERESQEIEVEKTLPLPVSDSATVPMMAPVAAGTPAPKPAAAPAPTVAAPAAPVSKSLDDAGGVPAKKSKAGLWIGIAALLLASAGGAWWWQGRSASATPAEQDSAQVSTPSMPDSGTAPGALGTADDGTLGVLDPEAEAAAKAEAEAAEAAAAQEALQAQIDSLVSDKASDMEEQLRSQMDQQLERLRGQLRDAQKAAEEREEELKAQQEAEAARKAAEEEAARKAAEEEAARKAAEEEAARKAAEEEAARKAAEEEAARKAAEEEAKPKVRRGDLVNAGPGVIPPRLVRFPTPRFPEMARRLNRTDVTVPVRVLVDENGKVVDAKPETSKKYGFGFDAEALNVARGAEYEAATSEGVPVKMWLTLRVRFK